MTVPVRLSVCQQAYLLNCTSDLYRIFLCMLPISVARSSFGAVAIRLAIVRLGGSVAGWLACWTQAQGMLVTVITRRVPVISALQRQGAGDVFIRPDAHKASLRALPVMMRMRMRRCVRLQKLVGHPQWRN